MVHVMAAPTRNIPLAHTSFDAEDVVVATPNTSKLCDPATITSPPVLTVIKNADELVAGLVENRNVAPPSNDTGTIDGDADDDTEKSEASAIVGPAKSETEMVHDIAVPTR
jgi:hypothetical protein